MKDNQTRVIVLAAGMGTRMKSALPKVMHELFFAPMLHHVMTALAPLELLPSTVVVTGHQAETVESSLTAFPVSFARQAKQLGTANAVQAAHSFLAGFAGTVLILCGDTPVIRTETIRELLYFHRQSETGLTVMTTRMADPGNYGRIITGPDGEIQRIVEEKDASPAEKAINEINAGIYCVGAPFLERGLDLVEDKNRQREFYLTDLVAIARREGIKVARFICPDAQEVLGVNSRVDLSEAHRLLQRRRNQQLMMDGVTIVNPESVAVTPEATLGRDTVINGPATISGRSSIGSGCLIGPQVVIHASRLGDGVKVGPFTFLSNCVIPPGREVSAGTIDQGS